ncbi:MAG: gamma-glutamyl-gamma-aminobutyrate hydrolase family protein [Phycisphaerae bacterium]|nr:gamma-glutamyl-gamma-aminobutyrate hydrolase family protein [Phycisphaerae bacterium]
MSRPLIGVNPNVVTLEEGRNVVQVNLQYLSMIERAGGAAVVLTPDPALADDYVSRLDGFVLSGGNDIDVRMFGQELHPTSEVMDPRRQIFDFALLKALDRRPETPTLGICLGMQEMGVNGGCRLIQHIHDEIADGERHGADRLHPVDGEFGAGPVRSWHHQALGTAGRFAVVAMSDDGVIEGIRDPQRPFYVGVQWHPERTENEVLGLQVVRRLVKAAATR